MAAEGAPAVVPGFSPAQRAAFCLSRTAERSRHSDAEVARWLEGKRGASRLRTRRLPLAGLDRWSLSAATGNISHDSGRFFSVTGVKVRHRIGSREIEWDQPIIDQPEVGILGLLAAPHDGVLHFCLQAKEEPGNLGGVQLSPTVQATYSNYTGAHGGGQTPLVDYFLDPPRRRLLYAKLQTEDGGRFLYKSNRNMIVLLAEGEAPEPGDDFIWLTLRQIAGLLAGDNLVNACARSILSVLFDCGRPSEPSLPAGLDETVQWFDDCKARHHIRVQRVGLNTLEEWRLDDAGALAHREGRFFQVVGLDVRSRGREVAAWQQPIICNPQRGIIGLLVRERDGERSFLMQAKAEVGNRTTVQLGPTVQFTPGNYSHNPKLFRPFLFELFSEAPSLAVLWENRQSEEGARFYREDHLHRVLQLPPGQSLDLPDGYRWLTAEQLRFYLAMGDFVNSCARSVLACLL